MSEPLPVYDPSPNLKLDKATLTKMLQEQNLATVQAFSQELQALCARYGVELSAEATLVIRVKE